MSQFVRFVPAVTGLSIGSAYYLTHRKNDPTDTGLKVFSSIFATYMGATTAELLLTTPRAPGAAFLTASVTGFIFYKRHVEDRARGDQSC